jgi:DNA-binding LacI/PurR family transcriptional regulator
MYSEESNKSSEQHLGGEAISQERGVPQTRTQEAYGRLAAMAQGLGPNAQLPKFVELRDMLGVSVATLNSALSLLETHRIVYRRHGVGIFVSPKLGRKSIALVCAPRFFEGPEISPFWQIFLDQIQEHSAQRGHDFTMHFAARSSMEKPLFEDFTRSVEEHRVQGVIGIGLSERVAHWLEEGRIPTVGFASQTRYSVDVSYESLVQDAVSYLAERGCRRIGLWTNHSWRDLPERFWEHPETLSVHRTVPVFQEALAERRLPYDPTLLQDSRLLPGEDGVGEPPRTFWEQGYQLALHVFGAGSNPKNRPEAIISPSELFTQGILTGLQRVGMVPGKDIQIVSHANRHSPVLRPWEQEITIVEVNPAELAQLMLTTLGDLMSGVAVPETQIMHHPRIAYQRK